MADTLETLLIQLRAMKRAAQEMVAREYPIDAEWDWQRTNRIWIGLNEDEDGDGWVCSWLMRPSVYAFSVLEAEGRTPLDAALALRKMMIKGE